MKISIKEWHGVARWRWNVDPDDMCGICQNEYDSTCGKCRYPGDECPLLWGKCGHVFHLHCITRGLQDEKGTCPMDRSQWITAPAEGSQDKSLTGTLLIVNENDNVN